MAVAIYHCNSADFFLNKKSDKIFLVPILLSKVGNKVLTERALKKNVFLGGSEEYS